MMKKVTVLKTDTPKEALEKCYFFFNLDKRTKMNEGILIERLRLRKCSFERLSSIVIPLCPLDTLDSRSLDDLEVTHWHNDVMLEEAFNDGSFPVFNQDDLQLFIRRYDDTLKVLLPPEIYAVNRMRTIRDMKVEKHFYIYI